MANHYKDIFADNKAGSRNFIGWLSLICFQPRQFFRLLEHLSINQSLIAASLILALLSFSAIQQANLISYEETLPELDEEFLPDAESEAVVFTSAGDPSESWRTGFSAAGKQVIYWLVLAIVLSEISLFRGKAPEFKRNLQIAVWSSIPFAMMAALQIIFVTGGGTINQPGFTGFLDEWQEYYELSPYLQSMVYALALQFTFFTLWNFVLLYKGARESLQGNCLVVGMVLFSWLVMLTLAYGFEYYQNSEPEMLTDIVELPYEEEQSAEAALYFEVESGVTGEELP